MPTNDKGYFVVGSCLWYWIKRKDWRTLSASFRFCHLILSYIIFNSLIESFPAILSQSDYLLHLKLVQFFFFFFFIFFSFHHRILLIKWYTYIPHKKLTLVGCFVIHKHKQVYQLSHIKQSSKRKRSFIILSSLLDKQNVAAQYFHKK